MNWDEDIPMPAAAREWEEWCEGDGPLDMADMDEGVKKADAAIAALVETIARWTPLIEAHDDLADLLADWAIAADRHGVPDDIEDSPESAFDFVQARAEQAEAKVARLRGAIDGHCCKCAVDARHTTHYSQLAEDLAARWEAEQK